MATTQLEKVTVEEMSKFGFKDKHGYISWGARLKDEAKIPVVPGRTFNMEIYTADSGTRYVNKVLQMVESADVPKAKSLPKASTKVSEPAGTKDAVMTRADWDAKDTRISRQGVIQAAVQAVASFSTAETMFKNAELLAKEMLKFVNQK